MRADQREELRVVEPETAVLPADVARAVARLARDREAGGSVVRRGRAFVVRAMAADAVARRALEHVVPVAVGAGHLHVLAGQRIRAVRERPGAGSPGGRGRAMTELTLCREAGGDVVRVLCPVEVGQVARRTVTGGALVQAVLVAGRAGRVGVRTVQGERRVVVEPRLGERDVRGAVAHVALHREPGGDVVWRLGRRVVLLVTARARHLGLGETAVGVARLAAQRAVRAVQRHVGHGAVIPAHGRPADGAVAALALGAELCLELVVLPAHPVTVVAGRRRAFEDALDVARLAGDRLVASRQRKRRVAVERAVRCLELRAGRNGAHQQREYQRQQPGVAIHRASLPPRASRAGARRATRSSLWQSAHRVPSWPLCTSR